MVSFFGEVDPSLIDWNSWNFRCMIFIIQQLEMWWDVVMMDSKGPTIPIGDSEKPPAKNFGHLQSYLQVQQGNVYNNNQWAVAQPNA